MVNSFWAWRLDTLLSNKLIKKEYWKIVQVIAFKNQVPIDCRGFDAETNAIRMLSKPEYKEMIPKEEQEILTKIIKGTLASD